jgi:micrococcal nuclease
MPIKILILAICILIPSHIEYKGQVLRVIDGDTFVLQTTEGNLKIRLDGIDAPEGKQCFGKESKEFLSQYTGKDCRLERIGLDRYGRTIGILWIDNVNINLLMVKKGYAWHFKKYSKDERLAEAEKHARLAKIGLWANDSAVAPWEWRKKRIN